MNNTQKYLKVEEVAKIYDVPEQTIRDWATNGELIAEKKGTRWFFPVDQFKPKIVCSFCGQEITGYNSEEDYLEARISGFCQSCIDKTFGGVEE